MPFDIEYSHEVKIYLLDNDPYTFQLHVCLEDLRHQPNAIPPEGATPLAVDPSILRWQILEHTVYYRKRGNLLTILHIRPDSSFDDEYGLLA